MFFAQISDTHVRANGERARGVAPVADHLERTVAFLNGLAPRPEFVLLTGDVLDDGGISQAREAARILSKLEMPLHVVPGNHDDRKALTEAFGSACPPASGGFVQYAFSAGPLRFIALDSSEPGRPGGVLCERRLEWLRNELAASRDVPVILFLHHPPVRLGVLETDVDGFEGAAALGEAIAGHAHILGILAGHVHLFAHAAFRGVPVTTAPPVSGMRLALDLTMREPSAFHMDDPAFLLHRYSPGDGLASHLVMVRENEPKHLF